MNALTTQPPRKLSTREITLKNRLEKDIRDNLEGFRRVGIALLTIRDEKLYREDYNTFEEYLLVEWDMGRRRAYQFIEAVGVITNLCTIVHISEEENSESTSSIDGETMLPLNEAQVRPLVSLPADKQRTIWRIVIEQSQAEGAKITALFVQQCVSAFLNTSIAKTLSKAKTITTRKESGIPESVQLTFQSLLEHVQHEADSNWSEVGKNNMAKMLRELLESIEA